ncbi:MAG: VOC family protein [Bacteroidota bacterium]
MFTRTGFILYVLNYEECVAFYRDVLGLPVLFEAPSLTSFEFGPSYLIVEFDDERDGMGTEAEVSVARAYHTMCLRMNVPDVKAYADRLTARGVEVDVQEHSWGTVAKFVDPAGNLCAFKDDALFEQQIRDHLPGV